MAMDKSKENSRVEEFIHADPGVIYINIIKNIKNPAILKHFLNTDGSSSFIVIAEYAMAAGLIDRDDVKWIKEHEEEPLNEESENGGAE